MSMAIHDARQPIKPASRLLEKAARLGLRPPTDLERLAVMRGCDYYERELEPRNPPLAEVQFSNAELALALLVPALVPTAREIRLAAALLGTQGLNSIEVSQLAIDEDCAAVVRYIAQCGQRYEPENHFWPALLDELPTEPVDVAQFPHPTRFVEMTGIDRGKVGVSTRWIRPRAQALA